MGRRLPFSDKQRSLHTLATERLKKYQETGRDELMREAQTLITEATRIDDENLPHRK